MANDDYKSRFKQNRELYARLLPKWREDFEETGNMRHDPYVKDWLMEFSPIESMVWQDIRSNGLPFYPQVPACGFFLDFACPMQGIAIECDGREYHSAEKDAIRDAKLEAEGWIVFRIQGHKCNRILPDPWGREEYPDGATDEQISAWFCNTSTGIVYAIQHMFFSQNYSESYKSFAEANMNQVFHTLDDHVSTRKTYREYLRSRGFD